METSKQELADGQKNIAQLNRPGRMRCFYPGNWQSTSIEQFIQAVHDYIVWHNEKRIKISLGSMSPIEYRERLGLIN